MCFRTHEVRIGYILELSHFLPICLVKLKTVLVVSAKIHLLMCKTWSHPVLIPLTENGFIDMHTCHNYSSMISSFTCTVFPCPFLISTCLKPNKTFFPLFLMQSILIKLHSLSKNFNTGLTAFKLHSELPIKAEIGDDIAFFSKPASVLFWF